MTQMAVKIAGKPCMLLLTICSAGTAFATDVFTWTDETGVTHFSQWAPDDVDDVSRQVVHATNPPGYDPQEDPYSVSNQAERTSEMWAALQARREERRDRNRGDEAVPPRKPAASFPEERHYSPAFYYRPVNRPVSLPIYAPGHRLRARPQPLPHASPAVPASFSPDPMRSAHIGVRSSADSSLTVAGQ
jgi:hypothetical protein